MSLYPETLSVEFTETGVLRIHCTKPIEAYAVKNWIADSGCNPECVEVIAESLDWMPHCKELIDVIGKDMREFRKWQSTRPKQEDGVCLVTVPADSNLAKNLGLKP